MTKEPLGPHFSLQISTPVTARELVTELERLAIAYPRADMDARKWKVLFETFYEDMKHKSLPEIREGCSRYRRSAENRFFPTPGQLLEACKNPLDAKPRRYEPLDDLPPAMTERDATALIDKIQRKYGYTSGTEKSASSIKEEILARPLPVMTPELQEREKALARERMEALSRRIDSGRQG